MSGFVIEVLEDSVAPLQIIWRTKLGFVASIQQVIQSASFLSQPFLL